MGESIVDTGYDYITPEFLNVIFFQQKSLVIFPYLDLKHLHSLEIFATSYNIVDLDSTAIHNTFELLEHASYDSNSQNPSLFFITNVTKDQLHKIMSLDTIHCIINSNENVGSLAVEGSNFIFYNKKNKKFLNFNTEDIDISFESWLIKNSQNQSILQDKIIKIKSVATQLFTELNQDADKKKLMDILSEYEKKYWEKIIQFTEKFYDIEVPDLPRVRISSDFAKQEILDEHSKEYELIIKSNTYIAREFVKALHEYRSKKVNPANLELMELFSPRQLYSYLRTHHWEQGIPEEFIQEWVNMNISHYPLSELDVNDFLTLFSELNIACMNIEFPTLRKEHLASSSLDNGNEEPKNRTIAIKEANVNIPSIQNFSLFKQWIYNKLDQIEARFKSQKS
jgi:hypothetical protein